jgi:ribosomal protein S12 methylthiotransferase accessory factor
LAHWLFTAQSDLLTRREDSASPASLQLALDEISALEDSGAIRTVCESLHIIETATRKISVHAVVPRRDCPRCLGLLPFLRAAIHDHVSPATGIVTELRKSDTPLSGTYFASCTFVSPLQSDGVSRPAPISGAFGRGRSRIEAERSCIGEALECYSAAYRGTEGLITAPLTALRNAIDPRAILLYSDFQYEQREVTNKILPERHRVPERFDPDRSIQWIKARGLTNPDREAWIPAALCLTGLPETGAQSWFSAPDTVGCACGPAYTDALLGAVLELIERDATAIWWYNRLQVPSVPVECFNDPDLLEIANGLPQRGRRLTLLNITSDLGVPTYVAVSAKFDGSSPIFGVATHVSGRIAAWKAASEAVQIWLCTKACPMPGDVWNWLATAHLQSHSHLAGSREVEATFEPTLKSASDQLEYATRRLLEAGLEAWVVDLCRPDVTCPVVRVFAPGMRSVLNRRAAGRLFDVPVQVGRLPHRLNESDLNPLCCMF